MIWESVGSLVLGLTLAGVALRLLPHRLPSHRTVFITGALGALFGAALTYSALGSGSFPAILSGAVLVGAVTLSLLIRPAVAGVRSAPAQ
ncbi:hypothetical protein NKH18_33790 [Streptomyces sp. M10(2022)]